MDPDTLRTGLARFAADLTFAGEPIAFDAVVERHLGFLLDIRAAKLRWPSVARMLEQAGARRADGKAISADQLRASVSRVKRRPPVGLAQPTPTVESLRLPRTPEPKHPLAGAPNREPTTSRLRPPSGSIEPDLSEADILSARQRILGS